MEPRQYNKPRLFEFRVRYNVDACVSAMDSYHYYMAENPNQALKFHLDTMERRQAIAQHVAVEKFNPWSRKWEDVSEVLEHMPNNNEN